MGLFNNHTNTSQIIKQACVCMFQDTSRSCDNGTCVRACVHQVVTVALQGPATMENHGTFSVVERTLHHAVYYCPVGIAISGSRPFLRYQRYWHGLILNFRYWLRTKMAHLKRVHLINAVTPTGETWRTAVILERILGAPLSCLLQSSSSGDLV